MTVSRCQSHTDALYKAKFSFLFSQNFLNLDVYYKYLTEEEIVQQPAFEFLSLLSEVC